MNNYKVGIIIVNYNGAKFNSECINSIKESEYKNYEIIFVDNNSTDDSIELLEKQFKDEITIIKSNENLGFSGGNNIGIEYALKNNCDFIMLLNNDTTINKKMINIMVDTSIKNKNAVISPKIYYYNTPNIIWSAGAKINWKKGIPSQYGIDQVDNGQFEKVISVECATGCCILVHRDIISEVGYLNDDYFLYYEDTDYTTEIVNNGFEILYQPKAIMYHKVSASTGGEESPNYIYYNTRNRLIYNSKFNKKNKFTYLPYFYLTRGIKIVCWILKRKTDMVKATLEGIRDYKNGVVGKRRG